MRYQSFSSIFYFVSICTIYCISFSPFFLFHSFIWYVFVCIVGVRCIIYIWSAIFNIYFRLHKLKREIAENNGYMSCLIRLMIIICKAINIIVVIYINIHRQHLVFSMPFTYSFSFATSNAFIFGPNHTFPASNMKWIWENIVHWTSVFEKTGINEHFHKTREEL